MQFFRKFYIYTRFVRKNDVNDINEEKDQIKEEENSFLRTLSTLTLG